MNIRKAIVTSLIILNVIVFFVMRNIKYQKRMLLEEKEWYEKEYAQHEDYDMPEENIEFEVEAEMPDPDLEAIDHFFPEFEKMKEIFYRYKNPFSYDRYAVEVLLQGQPKVLAKTIKSNMYGDGIDFYPFMTSKARSITFMSNGLILFYMPPTGHNPNGYKVCYAPEGSGQIEEYFWDNQVDLFSIENLGTPHWYYVQVYES